MVFFYVFSPHLTQSFYLSRLAHYLATSQSSDQLAPVVELMTAQLHIVLGRTLDDLYSHSLALARAHTPGAKSVLPGVRPAPSLGMTINFVPGIFSAAYIHLRLPLFILFIFVLQALRTRVRFVCATYYTSSAQCERRLNKGAHT